MSLSEPIGLTEDEALDLLGMAWSDFYSIYISDGFWFAYFTVEPAGTLLRATTHGMLGSMLISDWIERRPLRTTFPINRPPA